MCVASFRKMGESENQIWIQAPNPEKGLSEMVPPPFGQKIADLAQSLDLPKPRKGTITRSGISKNKHALLACIRASTALKEEGKGKGKREKREKRK